MGQLIQELKRRNVIRVGIAYAVAAWVLIEVTATIFPILSLPQWSVTLVTALLFIGFPIALIFAWAFEITPEGLKLEKHVVRDESITHHTGRKLDFIIIAMLVVALGYFGYDKFVLDPSRHTELVQTTTDAVIEQVTDGRTAESADKSIAVLPFVAMSSGEEDGYFADGLTEEILNSLARTPELRVSARTSSFAFKGSKNDIPTIANSLGVDHVLEGSVRRSGERLRVTAQLVQASDGFHLWSATYDRSRKDVIEIQENIAIEIAHALEVVMDPEALALMVSSGTSSVPAFEAFLRGLSHHANILASGFENEFKNAWDAYEAAINLDPEFARAYRMQADLMQRALQVNRVEYGSSDLTYDELLLSHEETISKAIEHEKDSVSKLEYSAYKAFASLEFVKAQRLYEEYLALRPNNQYAQRKHLEILGYVGMYDKANEEVINYYNRDGFDSGVTDMSIQSLRDGDDRDLLQSFAKTALDRFSNHQGIKYQAHRALLWAGDIDGAKEILPEVLSSNLPESARYVASLRQACAEGRLEDATRLYIAGKEQYSGFIAVQWLSHRIMGQEQEAVDLLMDLDNQQNLRGLADFLSYRAFDPRPYPNLIALLASQAIPPREVNVVPYRCRP
jgi:TolB-like protein